MPHSRRQELFSVVQNYLCSLQWKKIGAACIQAPTATDKREVQSGVIPNFSVLETLRILLDAAVQQRDLDTWSKALQICKTRTHLNCVSADAFVAACDAFEFDSIKET